MRIEVPAKAVVGGGKVPGDADGTGQNSQVADVCGSLALHKTTTVYPGRRGRGAVKRGDFMRGRDRTGEKERESGRR